ncbi:MAG: hypothetical protein ACI4JZ_06280, partial [Oscillospiraceae bacterium]
TAKLEKLNIKYIVQTKKSNDVPDGTVLKCSKEVGDLVRVSELEMVVVYIAENFEETSSEDIESSRD